MNIYLTPKKIKEINKRFNQYIKYTYTYNKLKIITGTLIYSRISKVEDNTFYLEIFINDDWDKTPEDTIKMFVNNWLYTIKELKYCKYYEADIYIGQSNNFTLLSNKNLKQLIDFIIESIDKSKYTKKNTQTNRNDLYNIETTVFKVLSSPLLKKYYINYNSFIRVFSYNKDDYYNPRIIGIPTILRIETKKNVYTDQPQINVFKKINSYKYAILTYKLTEILDSEFNIPKMKLDNIQFYNIEN